MCPGTGRKKPSAGELLRRWKQGDAAAGGELLERFYPELVRFARRSLPRTLKSRVDTLDVVQETCLAACRAKEHVEDRGTKSFESLLKVIVAYQIRKRLRDECAQRRDIRREESFFEVEQIAQKGKSPSERLSLSEEMQFLLAKVEELPEQDRKLLEWKLAQGKGWDQIAVEFGKSKEALQMKFRRLCRKIAEAYRRRTEKE